MDRCAVREYDNQALAELFTRLNFKSFLNKLDLKPETKEEITFDGKCEKVDCKQLEKLSKMYSEAVYRLYKKGSTADIAVTFDCKGFYFAEDVDDDTLKAFFESKDLRKIGFDVKDDILWLLKKGILYNALDFDTVIAAYIIEPSRSTYDIKGLGLDFLGFAPDTSSNEQENGQFFLDFDQPEGVNDTAAEELFTVYMLSRDFKKKIEENGQRRLYYDVELPLIEVLANMQNTGVFVDRAALVRFGDGLKANIAELEGLIYGYAEKKFNINSPKQLGEVLFEDLKLPHGKKTKTGYSTSVDVLKKLQGVHPIIDCIMDYRGLTKLQSTYVDGLLPVISNETGRIHSNFNQTVTATGRISSTEPNLQNIPVRTERGREMRRMFVAEGDKVLIDADYSQIELRVLAHIADDENMKSAFLSGDDIHTKTASQVFKVPVDEVTAAMRSGAKAVNFGIVYGIGEFSLSQDLHISIKEAKQYIEDYLATYPAVKEYMHSVVEDGRRDGFVSTLLGRRRYISELRASNRIVQGFGERVAMNAPIQGTAADIIKIAMVNVYKRLKKEGLKAKLILQVHDELIVEAEPCEAEQAKTILVSEMEKAMALSVPLKVDCNVGKTWFDTK